MKSTLRLEAISFDDTQPSRQDTSQQKLDELTKAAREDGYINGFSDGVERTREAADQKRVLLNTSLIEALADAQFHLQAARNGSEQAFSRILCQIITKIAPSLSHQGFEDHLKDRVKHILQQAPGAELHIRMQTDDITLLGQQLPEGVAVIDDISLQKNCARIFANHGFDLIDIPAIINAVQVELKNHIKILEQEMSHERCANR